MTSNTPFDPTVPGPQWAPPSTPGQPYFPEYGVAEQPAGYDGTWPPTSYQSYQSYQSHPEPANPYQPTDPYQGQWATPTPKKYLGLLVIGTILTVLGSLIALIGLGRMGAPNSAPGPGYTVAYVVTTLILTFMPLAIGISLLVIRSRRRRK